MGRVSHCPCRVPGPRGVFRAWCRLRFLSQAPPGLGHLQSPPSREPVWVLLPVSCCKRPVSHVGLPSPGTWPLLDRKSQGAPLLRAAGAAALGRPVG